MEKNQNGFGIFEGLLVLIILSLLGLLGWYVWSQNNSSQQNSSTFQSQTSQQNKDQAENTNLVSITLTSKSSGKPITRTKVRIYSDNGIRCIQAPCPTNGKSWEGITDQNGVIIVPKDHIQVTTSISPKGYQASSLKYDATKTIYEMVFDP